MSKGYYAIRLMVFHNKDDREEWLSQNDVSVLPITRKEGQTYYKKMQEPRMVKNVWCGSCGQYHLPGRIYKEKDDEE